MKLRKHISLLILTVCASVFFVKAQSPTKENWREVAPKSVTLYSRTKHKDKFEANGKSTFSFKHGARGDVGREITRNYYELLYGNISLDGDSDWFAVGMYKNSFSRIKNLGALDWSDIFDVPYLPASVEPHQGFRMPSKTESFEESSNGQVTRAVVGHIYVLHSKYSDSDFYTLFRVDKLVPSDEITISWKVVPSPEQ